MVGIAGIVYPDVFRINQQVDQMLATMQHRGRDVQEEQVYKNLHVGICGSVIARRSNLLAGLDGTIHNAKMLEDIARDADYALPSQNPAELLLFAYSIWGDRFLEYIDGDFVFFLVDEKQDKLLLARDRFGKKPLYWYHNQNHFIFGSELKAILASRLVPQSPAADGVAAYLYLGYLPRDLTLIENVNKLLPGYYMELKLGQQEQNKKIQQYWSLSVHFQSKQVESKQEITAHLDELLRETVASLIPKERSFGCLLSGGLGSSCVGYYLHQTVPRLKIPAYTVAFQGENIQDLRAAEEVANRLHFKHISEVVTPQNFLDDVVKSIWYLDEPLANVRFIGTWKLLELAQESSHIFSGMGSNELFAGHSRYIESGPQRDVKSQLWQLCWPLLKRFLLPLLMKLHHNAAFDLLKYGRSDTGQRIYMQQNALFEENLLREVAPRIADQFDLVVFLHKFHNLSKISSTVASYLYLDMKTRLVDDYVLQYERFSTAHGIKWHTPFLTRQLMEYVIGLADPDHLSNKETFHMLKSFLKDSLPESVMDRSQRMRPTFLSSWIEVSNLSELFALLPKGTLVESGFISGKWIEKQILTPESRRNSFKYLWAIVVLEIWFRLFINQKIQKYPPIISAWDLLSEK